jgi:hypothetical protein
MGLATNNNKKLFVYPLARDFKAPISALLCAHIILTLAFSRYPTPRPRLALRRMTDYRHRLLVITAALSQVKSSYDFAAVDPNRIMQSLIAVLAGIGVPFLCTEGRELGKEIVASYLYQAHLYHWLEANDYGRFLTDNDL